MALAKCVRGKSRRPVASDLATLRTVALQAPLPMGFSRQEYWRGLPVFSIPDPGMEPASPTLRADSLPSELPGKPYAKAAPGFHFHFPTSSKSSCLAPLSCKETNFKQMLKYHHRDTDVTAGKLEAELTPRLIPMQKHHRATLGSLRAALNSFVWSCSRSFWVLGLQIVSDW